MLISKQVLGDFSNDWGEHGARRLLMRLHISAANAQNVHPDEHTGHGNNHNRVNTFNRTPHRSFVHHTDHVNTFIILVDVKK